ncbi:hypothetical protein EXM22_02985 [Oceanispirochaeta crateris]|uniref:Porin n=1 Tax=Oceanispirochaeta crateris TaxID=2518645 RepID=A0A5C1QIM4_9SPIO|nr:hypothetical protein [Oceanispirochaeta crateris]QEN06999.1 hypothetical protein EXM22_02985 [Oceanispirochaeta crateris]
MNKIIWTLILCTFSISLISAKDDFFDLWEPEGNFYIESDYETAPTDYLELGFKMDNRFEITDAWEIGLEVDFKTDEVETDEVWVRFRQDRQRYQLGMFKNEILLEDQFSSKQVPFNLDSLIKNRLDEMGWYTSRALGFKAYQNYKEGTLPVSAYGHIFFQPSGREVQVNTGLFYPYKGEDSWVGITAAYYPYFIHKNWVGTASSHTQDHNFLFQAAIADMSGKGLFIYKGDVTLGNNLIDPVGYIHFPGEGEPSWFMGADILLAYPLKYDDFVWTPGLNTGFLIHSLDQMESWTASVRTGQLLAWDKTFFLHLEGGTDILTNYNSDGGESVLQTGLEIIWGISFEIRH